MSNLDKFFQEKLQNREFEFSEANWEQASQMIALEENQKRKRRFAWWVFIGLLIIGSGAISYLNLRNNDSNVTKLELVESIAEEKLNNDVNSSLENDTTNRTKENIFQNEEPDSKLIENQIIEPFKSTPTSTENIKLKENVKFDPKSTPIIETVKSNNDNQAPIANSGELKPIPEKNRTNELESIIFFSPYPNATKVEFDGEPNLLDYLVDTKAKEAISFVQKTKLGFTGGVALLANSNTSSISGYRAGFVAKFPISNKWSIGSEISYLLFKSDFGTSSLSEQINYGYGGETDIYALIPSSLHYLEVPVYIQRNLVKSTLYGGFGISSLLGAYGKMEFQDNRLPWQRTEEENLLVEEKIAMLRALESQEPYRYVEAETIQKGWLDTQNLQKIQTHLLLGYEFELKRNISLGLRLHYRLTNLHKSNPGFLKDDPRFMLQCSGTYFFK